ncbi:MAG: isoprenyl transferase [Deltaproteobacteria bacterium]|nr:MAG: isoprenyl transferase [Deltaproteobacteria bacterium]
MPTEEEQHRLNAGLAEVPRHVAVIMDGNGRWAAQRGKPRTWGHQEGARAVRAVVTRARELGVPWLTLYAFSAQNWRRPADEINALMALLIEFCQKERQLMMDKDIRLRVIGQRDRIPAPARFAAETVERATRDNRAMTLQIALSYGGREELVSAARQLVADALAGRIDPEDVDESALSARLWTAGAPDPDLVIRTSGELRVSNFLLWQIAYAEFVVDPRLWPDFGAADLDEALRTFAARERRFGAVRAPVR